MVKVFSIIAILAGLAAGAVGYFVVQPRIVTLEGKKAELTKNFSDEQTAHKKTQGELAQTVETLTTTSNNLVKTQMDLSSMTAKADQLEKDKTDLDGKLTAANRQITSLKQEYVEYLGVKEKLKITNVDVIFQTFEKLPLAEAARDTYEAENKVLSLQNKKLDNELDKLLAKEGKVKMPDGLAGAITAVDPKYQFVVLNIGGRHGVRTNGEMMIQRGGKVVGRVRITDVEDDHAVGNILQDWKKDDVAEGDSVTY